MSTDELEELIKKLMAKGVTVIVLVAGPAGQILGVTPGQDPATPPAISAPATPGGTGSTPTPTRPPAATATPSPTTAPRPSTTPAPGTGGAPTTAEPSGGTGDPPENVPAAPQTSAPSGTGVGGVQTIAPQGTWSGGTATGGTGTGGTGGTGTGGTGSGGTGTGTGGTGTGGTGTGGTGSGTGGTGTGSGTGGTGTGSGTGTGTGGTGSGGTGTGGTGTGSRGDTGTGGTAGGTGSGTGTGTGSGGTGGSTGGTGTGSGTGGTGQGNAGTGSGTGGTGTGGTGTGGAAAGGSPDGTATGGTGVSAGQGVTAAQKFGWGNPVRSDDFTGGTKGWSIYDGPGHAGNGRRTPDAVSVQNGILTITGDPEGNTAGMAWNPGQKYGRWEGRVKAPASDPSYNALLLLWPDAENFPSGGEVDFMEMSDHTRQATDMFLHYGSGNSQKQGNVKIDATQWHNWAVEWTPQHIAAYVDGEKWWETTDTSILPPGPMHLCIQLDWFPKNKSGGGVQTSNMQVDWVRQYAVAGSTGGGQADGDKQDGGGKQQDGG